MIQKKRFYSVVDMPICRRYNNQTMTAAGALFLITCQAKEAYLYAEDQLITYCERYNIPL